MIIDKQKQGYGSDKMSSRDNRKGCRGESPQGKVIS